MHRYRAAMLRWATRLLLALALVAAAPLPRSAGAARPRPAPDHLPDHGQRWVFVGDSLTRGLRVEPGQEFPAVFDRMTSGAYAVDLGRNGACLVARACYAWRPWVDEFEAAVFPRPSLTPARIVVLLGTNDLCKPDATVGELEAGYLRLAGLAAAHGTPITFLTVLPQAPPHAHCEDDRTAVNAWLLHESGLDVVDVATPLADPETGLLRPAYDADDGLHINAAGHRMIAVTLGLWAAAAGLVGAEGIEPPTTSL